MPQVPNVAPQGGSEEVACKLLPKRSSKSLRIDQVVLHDVVKEIRVMEPRGEHLKKQWCVILPMQGPEPVKLISCGRDSKNLPPQGPFGSLGD